MDQDYSAKVEMCEEMRAPQLW